jgi:hypothetical protein
VKGGTAVGAAEAVDGDAVTELVEGDGGSVLGVRERRAPVDGEVDERVDVEAGAVRLAAHDLEAEAEAGRARRRISSCSTPAAVTLGVGLRAGDDPAPIRAVPEAVGGPTPGRGHRPSRRPDQRHCAS